MFALSVIWMYSGVFGDVAEIRRVKCRVDKVHHLTRFSAFWAVFKTVYWSYCVVSQTPDLLK